MSASTPAFSPDAHRYGWVTYANEQISLIDKMSPEDLTLSIDRLRHKCIIASSHGLPKEEAEHFLRYPMTEKELELRAVLQTEFDALSADELQSHFSHFYQKGRIITKLAEAVTDDSKKRQLDCNGKANRLIIDELGKTLLRKGTPPQVPPAAIG